jgi:hypothetical protein
VYCQFCRSSRHTIKNCPRTAVGQINRAAMRCKYCGSRKHNIAGCPKTWQGSANRAWHKDAIADDYVQD